MAKPRKGLGRGLDSLIGGTSAEMYGNPNSEQQSNKVAEKQEQKTKPEQIESTPKPSPSESKAQQKAVPNNPNQREKPQKAIYENKEDNCTIKEVISRPAHHELKIQAPVEEKIEDSNIPVAEVLITDIRPNQDQPRIHFDKEALEELAASIKKDGLLQPLLVREIGNKQYEIIAGERRWQACNLLGIEKVPVHIKSADDEKAIELALIENIQRSDLNPIEEAYGYRRLMERSNMTQAGVAKAVSKGRSTIANALRLLELPEEAQQLLFEDKISAGHARAILSIPTEEGRQKLTDKLREEKLTVREAEAYARLLTGRETAQATPRPVTPDSFKNVARSLRKKLDTKVRVKTVKGKNKVEIEFKDEDELERIFAQLSN